jgi:hypothetical protein
LNVYGVNDVRQTEIQTAEPLVPEPNAFVVEMAIEKLKRHKSPSTEQIPAALVAALGRSMHSGIHKLINSIWNKEKLPEEWKESIVLPIYKKGDKQIVVIIEAYYFFNYVQNFIQHPSVKVNSLFRGDYLVSSVWIWTYPVNYWSYVLHLPTT